MTEVKDWKQMRDWCARILRRRTGAGVEEWNARVRDSGIDSEPALREWLAERDVIGYSQMLLVMERFGYPHYLVESADDLVAGQYADRQELRPILDRILTVIGSVGDVRVQARKTYVALESPLRQFAVIKPSTRTRVDLGLRLADEPVGGRLQPAKGVGNASITVRVALTAPDDVDDEVLALLRRTYAANC